MWWWNVTDLSISSIEFIESRCCQWVHSACWSRAFTFTFKSVFNGLLELEFAALSHDIAFQVLEYKHQSIESGYHWNADVIHRSTVVGCRIVNDHCGEQIVIPVGNLHIRGSNQRWIHLNHVVISNDFKHVWLIERSWQNDHTPL